jgi:molybdenum cofactor sulfurtransferase
MDAASLASTIALDLSHTDSSPDFVAISFYKIFGLPDLGALLVQKRHFPLSQRRRYFGGGTVEMSLQSPTHGTR